MAPDVGAEALKDFQAGATPGDESLVAAVLALGDGAAFAVLMRRHQRQIYHLLLRLCRNHAAAEDLCQETFLRAWSKLEHYEGRGSFAGWLSRIAYNLFLQHLRRWPPEKAMESLDVSAASSQAAGALTTPDHGDLLPELDRLLGAVSDEERTLLVLSYAGGLSATEIAAMLDRAPGTVKSQIHRAIEKIREKFAIEVGV
ncbi:MAG: sigma-70 family RNA polymerase sigma factor [Pseudomonadales bacterium]|nr:sigma-70 family RNA polymerase sigma factor [Pseudomonadales bacterium]